MQTALTRKFTVDEVAELANSLAVKGVDQSEAQNKIIDFEEKEGIEEGTEAYKQLLRVYRKLGSIETTRERSQSEGKRKGKEKKELKKAWDQARGRGGSREDPNQDPNQDARQSAQRQPAEMAQEVQQRLAQQPRRVVAQRQPNVTMAPHPSPQGSAPPSPRDPNGERINRNDPNDPNRGRGRRRRIIDSL